MRLSRKVRQPVKTLLTVSMINRSLRSGNGFILSMPVKRRRALVATNPIEE